MPSLTKDKPSQGLKSGGRKKAPPAMQDMRADYVDAKTAVQMLGIKLPTLYAYVSRGMIRSAPTPGDRPHLYHRQDVENLRMNRRGSKTDRLRRWGVGSTLPTGITSIGPKGPRYRGRLATNLADMRRPFEDCVELLWTGILPPRSTLWPAPQIPKSFSSFPASLLGNVMTCSSRQILAFLTGAYAASLGRNPESKLATPAIAGRQLLQILTPAIGLLGSKRQYAMPTGDVSIAEVIAQSADIAASEQTIAALNACLILSADHEIAPSTYTARVAASGGADIFSCVNSGLGTFEGPLTGLGCDEPERLLRAAPSPAGYVDLLKDQLRRKEAPMGFNHPLYREGDPRGRYLLKMAEEIPKTTSAARNMLACVNAAHDELGLMPSLAIGLAVMSSALKLPEESPGALMTIGRVSGWIAHVFEQRLAGAVIQPRTRYIGPLSEEPNRDPRA